jgi:hypothetical protein
VEATENYLHTNGLIEYPKLETSKTTFPLNYSSIQNGMPIFSEATAIQLFNDIDAYVQQEFNIATAINKDIAIVNLYPTLDQSDNIGIGVEVVIESSIGTGDDEDEQLDEGCNLFASWKTYPDGTGIGICGGGTSEFVKDAAERLQIVVNDRVGLNSCNPSICPGYYMNIVTLLTTPVSHPNPNDNIIGDGYREFLLFDSAENEPLYTDCLNPVEMNFYLNGAYQAIGNFMLQYTPFGLDYAFVNFVTVNQTNGINGFVHHNLYITLGTRVCYLDVEPVAN